MESIKANGRVNQLKVGVRENQYVRASDLEKVINAVDASPAISQESASGGGAISTHSYYTTLSTGGVENYTLAKGNQGQVKKIQMIVDGGDAIVTVAHLADGTTITFADAGDFAILKWTAGQWVAIELGNAADGVSAPVIS